MHTFLQSSIYSHEKSANVFFFSSSFHDSFIHVIAESLEKLAHIQMIRLIGFNFLQLSYSITLQEGMQRKNMHVWTCFGL